MIYETTPWAESLAVLDSALQRGELGAFVRGQGHYQCVPGSGWNGQDVTQALMVIERYIKESDKPELWRAFEDQLIALCDDPRYCWLCLDYVVGLSGILAHAPRPSPIGFGLLLPRLRQSLIRYKQQLEEMPSLGPAGSSNGRGLWGYVMHLACLAKASGFDLELGLGETTQELSTTPKLPPHEKKRWYDRAIQRFRLGTNSADVQRK